MRGKRLTTEEVKERIEDLTRGEYLLLGDYVNAHTKILVKHSLCENEYSVRWNHFKQGSRCPKCAGLEKLNNQEIDKRMYELTKNEYARLGEYVNANTKMLVKHNICGNEYIVRWGNFQTGNRCPKCSGLEKLNSQEIDKRMKKLVGDEYIRIGNYINNSTKMLVKHNICGNEYSVTWGHFQEGNRCPKCKASRLKELFGFDNKEIDKRIEDLVGDEYIRVGEYNGALDKMLIKHNICKNEYEVTWGNFKQGNRCPKCNESKGEKEISDILQSLNIKYTPQKRFKECKYKKTLPFDFYVHNKKSKLLIEFDGRQHFEPVEIFGGDDGLKETQLRDSIKTNFALSNNIPLLRIPYTEQDNIESILTNKLKELNFI